MATKSKVESKKSKDESPKHLPIVARDPYLEPYEGALQARAEYALRKEAELNGGQDLADRASGYLYLGVHNDRHNTQ